MDRTIKTLLLAIAIGVWGQLLTTWLATPLAMTNGYLWDMSKTLDKVRDHTERAQELTDEIDGKLWRMELDIDAISNETCNNPRLCGE